MLAENIDDAIAATSSALEDGSLPIVVNDTDIENMSISADECCCDEPRHIVNKDGELVEFNQSILDEVNDILERRAEREQEEIEMEKRGMERMRNEEDEEEND